MNQLQRKKGRERLGGEEETKFVGFKCPLGKKQELHSAARKMGLPNTSSLIRVIVDGWLSAFKKDANSVDNTGR